MPRVARSRRPGAREPKRAHGDWRRCSATWTTTAARRALIVVAPAPRAGRTAPGGRLRQHRSPKQPAKNRATGTAARGSRTRARIRPRRTIRATPAARTGLRVPRRRPPGMRARGLAHRLPAEQDQHSEINCRVAARNATVEGSSRPPRYDGSSVAQPQSCSRPGRRCSGRTARRPPSQPAGRASPIRLRGCRVGIRCAGRRPTAGATGGGSGTSRNSLTGRARRLPARRGRRHAEGHFASLPMRPRADGAGDGTWADDDRHGAASARSGAGPAGPRRRLPSRPAAHRAAGDEPMAQRLLAGLRSPTRRRTSSADEDGIADVDLVPEKPGWRWTGNGDDCCASPRRT